MKQIITIAFFIIAASTQAFAQPQPPRPQGGMGHEGKDLHQFQLNAIMRHLELDEDVQVKFSELYTQYAEQIKAAQPKVEDTPKNRRERPSDEVIEKQILDSFEIAEKTTAIKKEYYPLFKEILTPHQILTMYNIERQIGQRLNSEVENRANRNPPRGR